MDDKLADSTVGDMGTVETWAIPTSMLCWLRYIYISPWLVTLCWIVLDPFIFGKLQWISFPIMFEWMKDHPRRICCWHLLTLSATSPYLVTLGSSNMSNPQKKIGK
jgi:hypothetical protein